MNISNYLLNEQLVVHRGEMVTLIIENLNEYRKIINSCYLEDFLIEFYEKEEIIPIKKIEFISDIYNMDFGDRKIINLINNRISKIMDDEFNDYKTVNIKNEILNYFSEIILQLDVDIELSSEIKNREFLKSINWKICDCFDTELEKLINYIDIMIELKDLDIIVTKNAELFLSSEEIKKLINHLKIKKIIFLNIERRHTNFNVINGRNVVLFDEDLCRVL
ncbi:type II-A CRISPR-associated protein Csn2 [Lagierella sp.]|uniref:type II-A CRISPR-associated protein Csn2 n=1 Tax=Lagierella sp. TaxID=2849657 RepID=UPI00260659D8|nr:type II-A CRISPR-associated protein Csn2 [Lagierella sp.]